MKEKYCDLGEKNLNKKEQYILSKSDKNINKIGKKIKPFTIPKIEEYFKEKSDCDQGKQELPLIGSNDKMGINAPVKNETSIKKTYPQNWSAYNKAQTQEKLLFLEMLYELTSKIPKQKYKGNGRPPADIGEMVFCICLKIYHGFSSRRIESDLQLAKTLGYIEHVPHFNTLLKYLNKPQLKGILQTLIEISSQPLKLFEDKIAIDASGFSTSRFDRWQDIREKRLKRRLFKKVHIISGVKTNIIVGAEVTDGNVNDILLFEPLVQVAFENFQVKEVMADMAYSSRRNMGIVSRNGAIPFIPFKKNAKRAPRGTPIWSAMYDFFKNNKEEFLEHYHLRSNVESVFSMMKRKQGTHLKTKNDIAQVNEVLCKCFVHNICVLIQEMFELEISVDFNEERVWEFMCKIEV